MSKKFISMLVILALLCPSPTLLAQPQPKTALAPDSLFENKDKETKGDDAQDSDEAESFGQIGSQYRIRVATVPSPLAPRSISGSIRNIQTGKNQNFETRIFDSDLLTEERRNWIIRVAHDKPLIEQILDRFRFFSFWIYSTGDIAGDLLGFAYTRSRDPFIAMHHTVFDNPVAWFHEIAHFLIATRRLHLRLTNDHTLTVTPIDAAPIEIELSPETLRFIEQEHWPTGYWGGWQRNPHYLLRVLQREIFAETDQDLTRKVRVARLGEDVHYRVRWVEDTEGLSTYRLSIERRDNASSPYRTVHVLQPFEDFISNDAIIRMEALERLLNQNARDMHHHTRRLSSLIGHLYSVTDEISRIEKQREVMRSENYNQERLQALRRRAQSLRDSLAQVTAIQAYENWLQRSLENGVIPSLKERLSESQRQLPEYSLRKILEELGVNEQIVPEIMSALALFVRDGAVSLDSLSPENRDRLSASLNSALDNPRKIHRAISRAGADKAFPYILKHTFFAPTPIADQHRRRNLLRLSRNYARAQVRQEIDRIQSLRSSLAHDETATQGFIVQAQLHSSEIASCQTEILHWLYSVNDLKRGSRHVAEIRTWMHAIRAWTSPIYGWLFDQMRSAIGLTFSAAWVSVGFTVRLIGFIFYDLYLVVSTPVKLLGYVLVILLCVPFFAVYILWDAIGPRGRSLLKASLVLLIALFAYWRNKEDLHEFYKSLRDVISKTSQSAANRPATIKPSRGETSVEDEFASLEFSDSMPSDDNRNRNVSAGKLNFTESDIYEGFPDTFEPETTGLDMDQTTREGGPSLTYSYDVNPATGKIVVKISIQYHLAELTGNEAAEMFINGFYNDIRNGKITRNGRAVLRFNGEETEERVGVSLTLPRLRSGQRLQLLMLLNGKVIPRVFEKAGIAIDETGMLTSQFDTNRPAKLTYTIAKMTNNADLEVDTRPSQGMENEFKGIPPALLKELDEVKNKNTSEKLEKTALILNRFFAYQTGKLKIKLPPGMTWNSYMRAVLRKHHFLPADCDVLSVFALIFTRYLGIESVVVTGYNNTGGGNQLFRRQAHALLLVKLDGEWVFFDPSEFAPFLRGGIRFTGKESEKEFDQKMAEVEVEGRINQEKINAIKTEVERLAKEEEAEQAKKREATTHLPTRHKSSMFRPSDKLLGMLSGTIYANVQQEVAKAMHGVRMPMGPGGIPFDSPQALAEFVKDLKKRLAEQGLPIEDVKVSRVDYNVDTLLKDLAQNQRFNVRTNAFRKLKILLDSGQMNPADEERVIAAVASLLMGLESILEVEKQACHFLASILQQENPSRQYHTMLHVSRILKDRYQNINSRIRKVRQLLGGLATMEHVEKELITTLLNVVEESLTSDDSYTFQYGMGTWQRLREMAVNDPDLLNELNAIIGRLALRELNSSLRALADSLQEEETGRGGKDNVQKVIQALPEALKNVQDGNVVFRREALRVLNGLLKKLGSNPVVATEVVPIIIRKLLPDADPALRVEAVRTIARIAKNQSRRNPLLVRGLTEVLLRGPMQDSEPSVRKEAAKTLRLLSRMLDSKDPLRKEIIAAIPSVKPSTKLGASHLLPESVAKKLVNSALTDPDMEVRADATRALERLEDQGPGLAAILHRVLPELLSTDLKMRFRATKVLIALRDSPTEQLLEMFRGTEGTQQRLQLLRIFGRVALSPGKEGRNRNIEVFLEAMRDPSWEIRWTSLTILEKLALTFDDNREMLRSLVPIYLNALRDPSRAVRAKATAALTKIGPNIMSKQHPIVQIDSAMPAGKLVEASM